MVFSNNLLFGAAAASSGATPFDTTLIGNSVWIDGSADYLNKTPSAGTTTRWIWSSWVQRTEFGNAANAHTIFSAGSSTSNLSWIRFDDADRFDFAVYQGATTARKTSSAKYRDVGWYHLCVSFDSGSGVTASDRIKLFVNGIEVTDLSASTDTPSGETSAFNDNVTQEIGRYSFNGSQYGHAYLTQFTMLENKSFQNGDLSITDLLDSFTFGTNGSQFVPKADADIASLASTAGGNSFCLDFANSADLGNDISSNNNDFTPNSMAAVNQSTNTPSLVYPKISNIGIPSGDLASSYTMSFGSNRMVYSGGNQVAKGLIGTTLIQPNDPKIYWEYYVETGSVSGDGGRLGNGIAIANFNAGNGNGYFGAGGESAFFYRGTLYDNGSASVSGFTTAQAGDIQQMAFEPSTGKVWIGVEGTWRNGSGTDSTTLDINNHDDQLTVQDYIFIMGASRSSDIGVMNFGDNPTMSGNITAGGNADENGHGNFKYAVPSGFLAPNSANLTAPDSQGVDHFAVTLAQEGSLLSDMETAESSFSGYLRFYKSRASASATETWGFSFSHDASNEYILPANNTDMTYGSLRSFSGTDNWVGYSLDISSSAGTAAGSQSHSNGSDTTVTHNLGSSRYIVLLFSRSGSDIFYYHPDVSAGNLLALNTNVLPFSSTVITDITANTFDIGSAAATATYDYCVLAETQGVIDIFSYVGNSNTNGPFISLNAQPEFLTTKLTVTHATEHIVLDKAREPFNDSSMKSLLFNQLTAEGDSTGFATDLLSSAAKLRNSSTDMNSNTLTFVGWSFGKISGNGTLPPVYGQ